LRGLLAASSLPASRRNSTGDEDEAKRLEGLKKAAMAEAAEGLVAGTGWLPAILRTPGEPAEIQAD